MFFSSTSLAQNCTESNVSVVGRAGQNIELTTYEELENGKTAVMYPEAGFKLKTSAFCRNWSLTARVTGPFRSGPDYIDPHLVSIQFNTVVGGPPGSATGIPTNPFPLALSETTIIPASSTTLDGSVDRDFDIVYDMIIQGGAHLLALPNGIYRTDLNFTMYNELGFQVSTSSFPISFEIRYDAGQHSSLELLGNATNVLLAFNSGSDITNGITETFREGMAVHCRDPHQIMVKASSSHLLGAGTNNTIPISTITLSVEVNGRLPNVICYTRPLSVTSAVFVDNPVSGDNIWQETDYYDVIYALTYSIAGNDPNIIHAQIGTYSTSIVFTIVPK